MRIIILLATICPGWASKRIVETTTAKGIHTKIPDYYKIHSGNTLLIEQSKRLDKIGYITERTIEEYEQRVANGLIPQDNGGHLFTVRRPGKPAVVLLGTFHDRFPEAGKPDGFFDHFVGLLGTIKAERCYFELTTKTFRDFGLTKAIQRHSTLFDVHLCDYLDSYTTVETVALETIPEQMSGFTAGFGMKMKSDAEIKEHFEQEREQPRVPALLSSWLNGDRTTFWDTYGVHTNDFLYGAIVSGRNGKWFQKLENELRPHGVCVGTSHLYGPMGLLRYYLSQGATIQIHSDVWKTLPDRPEASFQCQISEGRFYDMKAKRYLQWHRAAILLDKNDPGLQQHLDQVGITLNQIQTFQTMQKAKTGDAESRLKSIEISKNYYASHDEQWKQEIRDVPGAKELLADIRYSQWLRAGALLGKNDPGLPEYLDQADITLNQIQTFRTMLKANAGNAESRLKCIEIAKNYYASQDEGWKQEIRDVPRAKELLVEWKARPVHVDPSQQTLEAQQVKQPHFLDWIVPVTQNGGKPASEKL